MKCPLDCAAGPIGKTDLVENRGNAPAEIGSTEPVETPPEPEVVNGWKLLSK